MCGRAVCVPPAAAFSPIKCNIKYTYTYKYMYTWRYPFNYKYTYKFTYTLNYKFTYLSTYKSNYNGDSYRILRQNLKIFQNLFSANSTNLQNF